MLNKLVFVVTQKLALLFVAGITVTGGFLSMGTGNHVSMSQTAIISGNTTSSLSTAPIAIELANIPFGLLPTTTIPFCTASSTCGEKGLRKLVLLFATKKPTSSSTSVVIAAAKIIPEKVLTVAASPSAPIQPITAQSFLADTTSSFKILLNGLDELVFTTNLSSSGIQTPLTWGLLTTNIGGAGTAGAAAVPEFSVSSSCTPVPNQPAPGAPDQNPSFNVRTAYDCTISLTPQSGADRRTQTKDFSFTTPPGEFIVMPDTALNAVLVNNANNGGIILNNQDSNPITVTSVTFNASYAYLATTLGLPLILRFQDPVTGQSLVDYPLTNLPPDPAASTTFSQSGVTLPLSLTIAPLSQKFLPIQVLGVQKMLVLNSTPSVNVTVTGVTIDHNDVKVVLNNPVVAWSCIVSQASYDPNATSGAYATGQACLH